MKITGRKTEKRSGKRTGKNPGIWFMRGGVLMIAAALLLTLFNLWDEYRADRAAEQVLEQMTVLPENADTSEEQEIPDYLLNPDMEMPALEIDDHDYIGILDIPVLELTLPVMSEWSYPNLKIAPCRYAGTAYKNNLVIAAHNYSTHFGRIRDLAAGDRVTFTDADGNVFSYTVAEVQTLEPTAVEEMTDGGWALTLFTCTLGGRSRVTVRCDLDENDIRSY